LEAQKSFDLANKKYIAELDTNKGKIRLEFLQDIAPGHVNNFLGLAKIGFYNGVTFHRVIDGFMIQGGCPQGTGTGDAGYKLPAEFNKTPHVAGVLSMARSNDPNSAGSQFFICVADAKFLDNNYTAFGKVADAESLAVAQAIGKVQTRSEKPVEKVVISSVTITDSAK